MDSQLEDEAVELSILSFNNFGIALKEFFLVGLVRLKLRTGALTFVGEASGDLELVLGGGGGGTRLFDNSECLSGTGGLSMDNEQLLLLLVEGKEFNLRNVPPVVAKVVVVVVTVEIAVMLPIL